MAMLEELGLSTCVQYLEGKKFMQLGSDQIGSYSSEIPSLSPLALIDLQRLIYKVRKKWKNENYHHNFIYITVFMWFLMWSEITNFYTTFIF